MDHRGWMDQIDISSWRGAWAAAAGVAVVIMQSKSLLAAVRGLDSDAVAR